MESSAGTGSDTPRTPVPLLATAYFPPLEYFHAIAVAGAAVIEQCENYLKQSYRNRCRIYSPNGDGLLSVPVLRASLHKTPIREVEIDHSEPWIQRHERAFEAAYNSSPFFEYYRDDIFAILERRHRYLFDLNLDLLRLLLDLSGIRADITLTESYEAAPAGLLDLRGRISPKNGGPNLMAEHKKEKTYFQVFSAKSGFVPNLSIVDLLSAEGPDAISYLR